jgi:protein-disulfide isomerase
MNEENKATNAGPKTNFLLGFFSGMALIALIAFFALVAIVFGNKQEVNLAAQAQPTADAPQAQAAPTEEPAAAAVPAIDGDDYVFGNKNADVVIIEYTDFECPFCARHFETAQQIKKEYGNKIAFVTRHFPLSFHPSAQKAAEASECAGDQGKFWEMYEELFALNTAGTMSVAEFKASAKSLGLNTSKFNKCLDNGTFAEKVKSQQAGGGLAGVSGTPATFINGQFISGALPFENFKSIIDSLL